MSERGKLTEGTSFLSASHFYPLVFFGDDDLLFDIFLVQSKWCLVFFSEQEECVSRENEGEKKLLDQNKAIVEKQREGKVRSELEGSRFAIWRFANSFDLSIAVGTSFFWSPAPVRRRL